MPVSCWDFEQLKPKKNIRPKKELHTVSCVCTLCTNAWLAVEALHRALMRQRAALKPQAAAANAEQLAAEAEAAGECGGPQLMRLLPAGCEAARAAALEAADSATAAAQESEVLGSRSARLQQLLAAAKCAEPTEACRRQLCDKCGAQRLQPFTDSVGLPATVELRQWRRVDPEAAPDAAAEPAAAGGSSGPARR